MKKYQIIIVSAIAALCASAQQNTGFDAKSAKAFFDAKPDLTQSAQEYMDKALANYAAGKLKPASDEMFASKYFDALAKYGANIPDDLRIELLAHPELLDEFFSLLSPADVKENVFKIIGDIWKKSPERFKKYPRLALAIAVVFDAPAPDIWPHAQVSTKLLPRNPTDAVSRFDKIVNMRERGKFLIQTERLSIEEAKYLAASPATDDDFEWAQKSVAINLSNIDKLYQSINYDHGRLNAKIFDWNGPDYRLKTIRETKGICTDQSYFTSEVAKARGVPAFIFSGAGSDGFHAWVGYMQRAGAWNFNVGRYEGARFVTGHTIDPQTWANATDHALNAMRESFRSGAKYRASIVHAMFAKHFAESASWKKAAFAAQSAIASDSRNADAWNLKIEALEKGKAEPAVVRAAYEGAIKAFFKYPDIDAEFRRRLITILASQNKRDDARRLTTSIVIKTKGARPDIAMEFARRELEVDISEGNAEKFATSYKRLLSTFKADAAIAINGITIPIINALLQQRKFDDTKTIIKLTRQVIKPSSKDPSIASNLENIISQLEAIIAKETGDSKK